MTRSNRPESHRFISKFTKTKVDVAQGRRATAVALAKYQSPFLLSKANYTTADDAGFSILERPEGAPLDYLGMEGPLTGDKAITVPGLAYNSSSSDNFRYNVARLMLSSSAAFSLSPPV